MPEVLIRVISFCLDAKKDVNQFPASSSISFRCSKLKGDKTPMTASISPAINKNGKRTSQEENLSWYPTTNFVLQVETSAPCKTRLSTQKCRNSTGAAMEAYCILNRFFNLTSNLQFSLGIDSSFL